MGVVRFIIRVPLLFLWLVIGLLVVWTLSIVATTAANRRFACLWYGLLLKILSVHLHVKGVPPISHGVMVCNHISWLDIVVLGALLPVRFISKAEVARWPLIGTLAKGVGTLFIQRGLHQAKSLYAQMADCFKTPNIVAFYPEATTGSGWPLMKFHPRLFGGAIETGVPVQPVALHYCHETQPHPVVPYIGEQSFIGNLYQLMFLSRIDVMVHFLPAMESHDQLRRTLAESSHDAIGTVLQQALTHPSCQPEGLDS
jgi:1-acyl-sn-glycerol-3-phosphate acyltransferase